MAKETIARQDFVDSGEYDTITWKQKTLTTDDTYEDCIDFANDKQDYILLVRPSGSNGSVRMTWTDEPYEASVTKEIAINDGDIVVLTPMGSELGSTPVIEGKLTTVSGNTLDFALLKVKEAF